MLKSQTILTKSQIGFWPRFAYLSQIQTHQDKDFESNQEEIKSNQTFDPIFTGKVGFPSSSISQVE